MGMFRRLPIITKIISKFKAGFGDTEGPASLPQTEVSGFRHAHSELLD